MTCTLALKVTSVGGGEGKRISSDIMRRISKEKPCWLAQFSRVSFPQNFPSVSREWIESDSRQVSRDLIKKRTLFFPNGWWFVILKPSSQMVSLPLSWTLEDERLASIALPRALKYINSISQGHSFANKFHFHFSKTDFLSLSISS